MECAGSVYALQEPLGLVESVDVPAAAASQLHRIAVVWGMQNEGSQASKLKNQVRCVAEY